MNWLMKFMYGRYGFDKMNTVLMIASFVFPLAAVFVPKGIASSILMLLQLALLGYVMFRALSKNIASRRYENDRFLTFWRPIENFFKLQYDRFRDRKTHRYFRCPKCGNALRVPKGKGEITITCPVCKTRFDKKT